jgi:hypothetical protein
MSKTNKKVNEIKLSSLLGSYGAATLGQMAGKNKGLSTQEIMTRDIFIKDFVSDALQSLYSAIKGNLVDPKLTAQPQQTAPAAKSNVPQAASANKINMTYQGKPVDTKPANLAPNIPSAPSAATSQTTQTPAPTTPAVQPRQTVKQKAQPYLQKQAAMKAAGRKNQPVREDLDNYMKLDMLFEAIIDKMTEQEAQSQQYTIKDYLKQVWLPDYLKGVNYNPHEANIDKLLQQVQDSYMKDRGKTALNTLANLAYSITPKSKPKATAQQKKPEQTPPSQQNVRKQGTQAEEPVKVKYDGIEYTQGTDGWIDPTGRIAGKNIAKYLDQIAKQQ